MHQKCLIFPQPLAGPMCGQICRIMNFRTASSMHVSDVVIRLKRKRGESIPGEILVSGDCDLSRVTRRLRRVGRDVDKYSDSSAELDSAAVIFKRVRSTSDLTFSSSGKFQSATTIAPSVPDPLQVNAQSAKSLVEVCRYAARHRVYDEDSSSCGKFHLIDVIIREDACNDALSSAAEKERYSSVERIRSLDGPVQVFNPLERKTDEAIWFAFQNRNASIITEIIGLGGNVNFSRRNSDMTTPLMAAAYCSDERIVDQLLALKANPCAVDVYGNTAAKIASLMGNHKMSEKLQMAELKWKIDHCENEDVVYDFYTYDFSIADEADDCRMKYLALNLKDFCNLNTSSEETPSDSAEAFFSSNLDQIDFEILYEEVSAESEADEDDSNAEDFYKNTYPDESECEWNDDEFSSDDTYGEEKYEDTDSS